MNNLSIRTFFNYFFLVGILLSFIIPVIFYMAFNSAKEVIIPSPNAALEGIIYHIDECNVKDNSIFVRGWSTPLSGYGQNLVYAKTENGPISLRTSIQNRPDVSAIMNKTGLYDKSGYVASLRMPEKLQVASIVVVTKEGGKIYSVENTCERK